MNSEYNRLKAELSEELIQILEYWSSNTLDHKHGGFFGERDFYNNLVPNAPKGIILNTRILWAFSASSNHLKNHLYKTICDRAFIYLKTFFKDKINEGVYWELDFIGSPVNKRKQIYAQAFTIYALSEYYLLSGNHEAKQWAIDLFYLIEKHAKDAANEGYFEAFKEDWSPVEDMRLSQKDINASKTMNTHLHILEAYTTLLKIYKHDDVKNALTYLVNLMFDKFLNPSHTFELFFDDDWNLCSDAVSFGHDIEAAWLIIDAARTLEDPLLISKAESAALKIADQFIATALDENGAVMNEKNRKTGKIDTDLHWWPQVEAILGLDYVYKISNNEKYIEISQRIWSFLKKHIKDHTNGEWHFRVNKDHKPYEIESKVSMWKAPYHNSRACIMINK